MAYNFGGKIVRDGLVMYLDAANAKSYASGSTSWNDLTINKNNGVLTNGPIFDPANAGSIVFDAIDDQVVVPPAQSINDLPKNQITVSSWIYSMTGAPHFNRHTIAEKRSGNDGWILSVRPDLNVVRCFILVPGWVNPTNVVEASPRNGETFFNRWNNVTMTYNNTTDRLVRIYVNGVEGIYNRQNVNPPFTQSDASANLTVGWGNFTTEFSGRISQLDIYNRVLSAQEVLQNYNAIKGRYGLP